MLTASFLGETHTVRALLDHNLDNADPAIRCQGLSVALHMSVRRGDEVLARLLLEQGADINDSSGYVNRQEIAWEGGPLEAACEEGHQHMVDLLLEPFYGLKTSGEAYDWAIVCAAGSSASHSASTNMVRHLLARATSLRRPDFISETFIAACSTGNEAVANIALEEGSFDMNESSGYTTSTMPGVCVTTALVAAAERGHANLVKLVLAKDDMRVDKYKGCHDKRKAMEVAIYNGHEQVVKLLLPIRFRCLLTSDHEWSVRNWFVEAAKEGHVHLMRLFWSEGVDLGARARFGGCQCRTIGTQALFDAIKQDHEPAMRLLLNLEVWTEEVCQSFRSSSDSRSGSGKEADGSRLSCDFLPAALEIHQIENHVRQV